MKRYLYLSITICAIFLNCKINETILDVPLYNKVTTEIIENPKEVLDKDLSFFLSNLKTKYSSYTFETRRHFVLTGINFFFDKNTRINLQFNWEKSDFDFGGGLTNSNTWDFEALKKEKIGTVKLYVNEIEAYHIKYR